MREKKKKKRTLCKSTGKQTKEALDLSQFIDEKDDDMSEEAEHVIIGSLFSFFEIVKGL